jgi:sugar lactone lactonase YvrE
MKSLTRIGFVILLLVYLNLIGFAQSGIITTYAGPGLPPNGSSASGQAIGAPSSVAADGAGGFYVAICGQHLVYHITADSKISLTAGSGAPGFSGDGGPAVSAQLFLPNGLAVDAAGNLYIADSGNNRIRKVTPDGVIGTFAGTGTADALGDSGPAAAADLNYPMGVAMDTAGNLYIADSGNNRIRKVTSGGVISTVAGTGAASFGGDDAAATQALLARPTGVAIDADGNILIADSANQRIREITTDGNIHTVVGNGIQGFSGDGGPAVSAELNTPLAIGLDSTANLYIVDSFNFRIRKATPATILAATSTTATTITSGTITTIAGNGTAGFGGDGGPATSAQLYLPAGLTVDSAGNLFIADYVNRRVRKVTSSGVISTVAGTGMEGFGGDGGPAASALFHLPTSVAVDSTGNLYIADSSNSRVRKVTAGGVISTAAGSGNKGFSGDGGQATSAGLDSPVGVAVDASGNLFIADYAGQRIRKVSPGGVISTVAGNGTQGYGGDGAPAAAAELNEPWGVAVDASGNLFIADLVNHRIRKVGPDGVINTAAGTGIPGFSGDGGPAAYAQLKYPAGVAVDSKGNLFIADSGNHSIRKVTPAGIIGTIAGNGRAGFSGDGGPATSAQLNGPTSIAIDAAGDLFVVDHNNNRIREITPDGVIHTVAGLGTAGFSGDGGQAISAQLNAPMGIAVDSTGNLFVADYDNSRIRKIAPQDTIASFVPQVVVGSGYSTLFAISNAGPAAASGRLTLTNPQGEALSVTGVVKDSTGVTRSSSNGNEFPITVPAGETVFLTAGGLDAESPVEAGWGKLESTAGILTVAATYEYFADSTLQTVVDTLQSPPLQSATIAVDNDSSRGRQLAYAIANPGDEAIAVTLTLIGQDGTVAGDPVTLALGPKQQIAHYLWQDILRTDFRGSLALRSQAGGTFVAVALLDDRGVLTAAPVLSGSTAVEASSQESF